MTGRTGSWGAATLAFAGLLLAGCQESTNHYEAHLDSTGSGGPALAANGSPAYEFTDLAPGARPALDTDEAGLWMVMDQEERKLRTSGNLIRDEALNAYVNGVVCRIAGPYCDDVRVYLVRVPYFNASMAPNGVMQIWSGLLPRVRNEAQLATVLGHELAHYLRRHSLQRMRDALDTTNALIFFQMATAFAGVGFVGDLAMLGALGSIQANSRDHEREADGYGLTLLTRAGYDPKEAAEVWRQVQRERDALKDGDPTPPFFASHPPSTERLDALTRLATKLEGQGSGDVGRDRYWAVVSPHLDGFIRDELRLREFGRAGVMMDGLIAAGIDAGRVAFHRGELYRLRDEDGDLERAIEAYASAFTAGTPPPEIHRSMGLVWRRLEEPQKARDAFARYLAAAPDAADREMIRSMLEEPNQ